MSVSTVHVDYSNNLKKWTRCRDVVEGKDKLVARDLGSSQAGGSYLQKPEGLDINEYTAYVNRASWFGATSRTVDALSGLIMSKSSTIDFPSSLKTYLDDITLSGVNLREFVQDAVVQQLTTGRQGVFVDYPATSTAGMTKVNVERLNIRPWLKLYKAEAIINWRTAIINNVNKLSLVVLKEDVEVSNEFKTEIVIQYRVLDLVDNQYRVRVFSDENYDGDSQLGEDSYPEMGGVRMSNIPFFISGGVGVRKPPLLDLVDVNIGHYRNSADYEHSLRFTVPMPIISGVTASEEDKKITIGSLTALVLQDPAAKGSYLEFSGQGLKPLQEAMVDKEFRMAVLGARMLSDEKKASEAVGTVEIRTSAERSILTDLSNDVSDSIQKALKVVAEWSGESSDAIRYSLNVDYGMNRLDHQTIAQLVSAWQMDAITYKTLYENLSRGDIISPDEQFEEYQDSIVNNPFSAQSQQMEDYAVGKVAETDKSFVDSVKSRLGLS